MCMLLFRAWFRNVQLPSDIGRFHFSCPVYGGMCISKWYKCRRWFCNSPKQLFYLLGIFGFLSLDFVLRVLVKAHDDLAAGLLGGWGRYVGRC